MFEIVLKDKEEDDVEEELKDDDDDDDDDDKKLLLPGKNSLSIPYMCVSLYVRLCMCTVDDDDDGRTIIERERKTLLGQRRRETDEAG